MVFVVVRHDGNQVPEIVCPSPYDPISEGRWQDEAAFHRWKQVYTETHSLRWPMSYEPRKASKKTFQTRCELKFPAALRGLLNFQLSRYGGTTELQPEIGLIVIKRELENLNGGPELFIRN